VLVGGGKDVELPLLGPGVREACVCRWGLLFSPAPLYRATSTDVFCSSVFVLTNQQKAHLVHWCLLLLRFLSTLLHLPSRL